MAELCILGTCNLSTVGKFPVIGVQLDPHAGYKKVLIYIVKLSLFCFCCFKKTHLIALPKV